MRHAKTSNAWQIVWHSTTVCSMNHSRPMRRQCSATTGRLATRAYRVVNLLSPHRLLANAVARNGTGLSHFSPLLTLRLGAAPAVGDMEGVKAVARSRSILATASSRTAP